MIKGVNHQIIEVRQTNNPYFERALLFVKAAYMQEPREYLQQEGERYLDKAESFSALRQNRAMRWFKRCALVLLGGIGGVLCGVLLMSIG